MILASVKPDLLRWARERAGCTQEELTVKFPKLPLWESGQERPTLRQAEAFARAVHVPSGCLLFSKPPLEILPIPDFRTFARRKVLRPSANLMDTIYACRERQDWYREFARANGHPELAFVGSASVESSPRDVAARMRDVSGFDLDEQRKSATWAEALRQLVRRFEQSGVLVMASGIVGHNIRRPLDPAEFRGFAICDPLAPLVFVNSKDTKAAQMFTLAHELAHIWLGSSALSNVGMSPERSAPREEIWCNAVAAEFLVPLEIFQRDLRRGETLHDALPRLARKFKVSTLVILRRLLDARWLTRERFDIAWAEENERLNAKSQSGDSGGGDFYRTAITRVSRRFAHALVVDTMSGRTLYRDAFWMLGINKSDTFNRLGQEIGVIN